MLSCLFALALAASDVQVEREAPERSTAFRVALDAGLPGGLAAGLQLEPVPAFRLSLAALHNILGFGVRGGVEVLPFPRAPLHPLIGVEAGHHFDGDARRLFKNAPERLSYTFVTGLLGVEAVIGRVALHAAAGVSGIWARASAVTFYSRFTVDGLQLDGAMFAARLGLSVRLF